MRFDLVDAVVERTDSHAITRKNITNAEEYLRDHFPTFPVLPGVLMLESLVQAARLVGAARSPGVPLVLGSVRALRYGRFMKPGDTLRVNVKLLKSDNHTHEFSGEGTDEATGETAVSGKFSLRPLNLCR